jgi:hypothetical protein
MGGDNEEVEDGEVEEVGEIAGSPPQLPVEDALHDGAAEDGELGEEGEAGIEAGQSKPERASSAMDLEEGELSADAPDPLINLLEEGELEEGELFVDDEDEYVTATAFPSADRREQSCFFRNSE